MDWRGRRVGLWATLAWCGAMDTRWTRTNPHHSRCVELLLPTQALRAFLGVSPIGTERHIVSSLSVLELCPLLDAPSVMLIFVVRFEYIFETVAVTHQRALC